MSPFQTTVWDSSMDDLVTDSCSSVMGIAYLIFVIFFTQAKFLENKIYTKIYTVNCQFFALNL